MSNITNLNRDYLIKINVKEATIDVPKMTFWNTDKKTSNMFVQLVINMSENELIKNYVTIENATDYKITLNVIKPKTNQYRTFEAKLLNEEKALFEIDLTSEFIDQVGNYNFEFEVSSKVDNNDESITTSNGTYEVKGSILTNLNQEISSSPDLPILKQLIEQVKQLQGGDLTGYQKKEDETLETTSKKVVGAINEVNSQFKDILDNVPRVVSEEVKLTIPASTISEKKPEIDNVESDDMVTFDVECNVVYDPSKSYFLKYNNKEYYMTYTEGVLTVIKDDCTCGIQPDGTNAIVMIMSLDTTNITDMQLIEKDINMLDNLFMPDDIKINNSITVGLRAGVIGNSSSSFGYSCEASGHASHAEGSFTTASGQCSHAEGNNTTASGNKSHAEGNNTTASGSPSHAEGSNTKASGTHSHAEGSFTTATADYSHAEGATTTASGQCSHAEGNNTTASGWGSHAEGDNTIALGSHSHSEGDSTTASSPNQHVQGKYNIEDTEGKYAHIVGNGSDGNKSNAHTLDWEGNAWYAGTLSQDGTPTKDKDLITKKYLNDTLNDTIKKDIQDINTQLGDIANNFSTEQADTEIILKYGNTTILTIPLSGLTPTEIQNI